MLWLMDAKTFSEFSSGRTIACFGNNKKPRNGAILALTRLIAGVLLVDDVNAALALDDFAIDVALFKRFQGIGDFHGYNP